jgi:hypothetical protein
VSAKGVAGGSLSTGKLSVEEDGGSMGEGIDSSKSDSSARAGEFSAEEGGVVAGLGSGNGRGAGRGDGGGERSPPHSPQRHPRLFAVHREPQVSGAFLI